MKTILEKLVSAKFTIFLIIGLFGLVLNLISFIGYNEFFSPTFSSFLAFSTAIVFNYFCHGRFLWQSHSPQIFFLQLKYLFFLFVPYHHEGLEQDHKKNLEYQHLKKLLKFFLQLNQIFQFQQK